MKANPKTGLFPAPSKQGSGRFVVFDRVYGRYVGPSQDKRPTPNQVGVLTGEHEAVVVEVDPNWTPPLVPGIDIPIAPGS